MSTFPKQVWPGSRVRQTCRRVGCCNAHTACNTPVIKGPRGIRVTRGNRFRFHATSLERVSLARAFAAASTVNELHCCCWDVSKLRIAARPFRQLDNKTLAKSRATSHLIGEQPL